MKQISIKETQAILLEMAKVVHEIASQHGIPLFMVGGTMLGAIRHKGFIPWDDDMDFGVFYQDYPRLISILNNELPNRMRCLTYDKSETYLLPWIKIEDTATKVIDKALNVGEDKMPVLTIDIFPFVSCQKEYSLHTIQKIQQWIKIKRMVYAKANGTGSMAKNLLKRGMATMFPISQKSICNRIMKLTDTIAPGDFYAMTVDPCYSINFFPRNWFEPLVKYDFGNASFYGITPYDNYLKILYNNYMELPPEEKRRTHMLDTYLK